MPDDVDPVAPALRESAGDDVDADVFVGLQRPGGAEHENGPEQVPLQLEPSIGGSTEDFADDRVNRRDEHGHHDGPRRDLADPLVQEVDDTADPKKSRHAPTCRSSACASSKTWQACCC